MHRELSAEFCRMLHTPGIERLAVAAPRGNAKTTLLKAWIGYCIVYEAKHYILYITSESTMANSVLTDIAYEIEESPRLLQDFPLTAGRGPVWRQNMIITRADTRVQALGAQKKIRGRTHRQHRPDLVLFDDLENDEHVRNPEQRDKMEEWLTKAVLKTPGVGQKCDFIGTGTILHFDSMLARLLSPRRTGWRKRIYKAVVKWSAHPELWERWEQLYCDFMKADDVREAAALAFFVKNEAAMLEGTDVLWPEGESYYALMKGRIDDGPTAFQSEKQNEPLDPEKCDFPEAWFRWFTEIVEADDTYLTPDEGTTVKLSDCDCFGAVDPSMGNLDKHGDPSALVTIACYPAERLPAYKGRYRKFFVLDASIERRHPHVIEEEFIEMHNLRHYVRYGAEAIQFQELFAESVEERAMNDPRVDALPIVKLKPTKDKKLRIRKLGQYIHSARMIFNKKLTTLYDQLRYYPQHTHDDGPDCVEMVMEVIGEIRWTYIDLNEKEKPMGDESPPKDIEKRKKAEEREDMGRQITQGEHAGIFDPDLKMTNTCDECIHWEDRAGVGGYCLMRGFQVDAKEPGCDLYDAKDD